ncbi:MAG: hypothetical protein AAB403_22955 [Planctomycetota bacterium]|mgnify:CR=1 FL=1
MDWTNADKEMVNRIIDEGQTYLDAQLRLATSADGRAAALAGMLTAAATALMAGLIALTIASQIKLQDKYPIFFGGGLAAALFLLAAALCIWALVPIGFYLPGNEPKSWFGDIETKKQLADALGEEAQYIQEKIEENRAAIDLNAKKFRAAAILAIVAPTTGVLVWLLSSFWERILALI